MSNLSLNDKVAIVISNSDALFANDDRAKEFVRMLLSMPFMYLMTMPASTHYYVENNELIGRPFASVMQSKNGVLDIINNFGLTRKVLFEKMGHENFEGYGYLYALKSMGDSENFFVRWAFFTTVT